MPEQAGRYSKSPDAALTPVGDRVVLYHRKSNTAVVLNPTGSWIWNSLSDARSPEEIATALRARFPSLSPDDAGRDVDRFLDELTRHQLVTVAR